MAIKKNDNAAVADAPEAEADNRADLSAGVGANTDVFTDLDVSSVPETVVLPVGDYLCKVLKAEVKRPEAKPGKSPWHYINVMLGFPDNLEADEVFWMVPVPMPSDDEFQKKNKLKRVKEFTDACGIDTAGRSWGPAEATGAEFTVRLTQKNDQNGNPRNEVSHVVKSA